MAVVGWAALAVLVVGAFLAALGGLNATIYSSSSFVERYLEALADDDIGAASSTPGVALDAAELEAAACLPTSRPRCCARRRRRRARRRHGS